MLGFYFIAREESMINVVFSLSLYLFNGNKIHQMKKNKA